MSDCLEEWKDGARADHRHFELGWPDRDSNQRTIVILSLGPQRVMILLIRVHNGWYANQLYLSGTTYLKSECSWKSLLISSKWFRENFLNTWIKTDRTQEKWPQFLNNKKKHSDYFYYSLSKRRRKRRVVTPHALEKWALIVLYVSSVVVVEVLLLYLFMKGRFSNLAMKKCNQCSNGRVGFLIGILTDFGFRISVLLSSVSFFSRCFFRVFFLP